MATESRSVTGGADSRLKRRLLQGAVDDNLRAIRNQPRGRLYRRPPLRRWLPLALALIAVALAAWAISSRPTGPSAGALPDNAQADLGPRAEAPPLDLPAADARVPTRFPSTALSLPVRRIILDPGHGGGDEGTKTPNGLTEKDLTLDIAQRVALRLIDLGFEVSLTREGDSKLFLRDRVRFANARKADLFLSIHVNWLQDGRANRGIETYYLGPSDDPFISALASAENRESGYSMADARALLDSIYSDVRQQESRRLALAVHRHLIDSARQLSREVRDRGVRSAPFLVLVETGMPAVLAEVASLASPEEARLLASADHRERIARALAEGIRAYSADTTVISERKEAR